MKALDRESFEAAKSKCGLTEATYFPGGFGFELPVGQKAPTPEQESKIVCIERELAAFDYQVVIETPPQ